MSLFSLLFKYKDKKSPDKLGLYPESFHVPAFPERRYLWTSRFLVVMAVMSICFNIVLVSIIYVLVPQKKSGPSLFQEGADSYQLESALPEQTKTYFIDLLTEGYIRDYINMRHAIPQSNTDLYYRWDKNSKFYWYSSSSEYYKFVNKLDRKQIRKFIRLKMKRTVEFESVKKLAGNLWVAQFKTFTSTKNMPDPDVIIWRAYIRVHYNAFYEYEDIEKDDIDKEHLHNNPFGFRVLSFNLGYAGKPQKADSALETAKKVFENIEDVVK